MSARLLWITDPHFDLAAKGSERRLAREVVASDPTAIVVTGDIGVAHDVVAYLATFEDELRRGGLTAPLFFVLGNHDFYGEQIAVTRTHVATFVRAHSAAVSYLSHADGPTWLADGVALIGHDGWADGRHGDYDTSSGVFVEHPLVQRALREMCGGRVDPNVVEVLRRQLGNQVVTIADYKKIRDFANLPAFERLLIMQDLADGAAAHIARLGGIALRTAGLLVVATHVPPFAEAAVRGDGDLSDARYLPHMASRVMGSVLLDLARAHPHAQIVVLTGHTHGPGDLRPVANLRVLTGAADYYQPRITGLLTLNTRHVEVSLTEPGT